MTGLKAARKEEKPLMTRSVYNLARNNSFDCSKAAIELSYHPRPYSETIKDEIIRENIAAIHLTYGRHLQMSKALPACLQIQKYS